MMYLPQVRSYRYLSNLDLGMNIPDKIFLVGMPGSGKSTIGKELAAGLDYKFVDLDEVIEGKANAKITEIFKDKGEDYFRELEALSLTEVIHNCHKVVVATGGGAPCFHDGMTYINKFGFSVYLAVSLDSLSQRLSTASHRPLINQMAEDELIQGVEEKLSKREPVYNRSHLVISNDNKTVRKVVKEITDYFTENT